MGYLLEVATFGENLRRIRDAGGFKTAKSLADALGVSQPVVSRWENDATGLPEAPTLLKLAKTLNCTVDDLLEGIDPIYEQLKEAARAIAGRYGDDVEDERVDVSGHMREDIPVIAEGEASPQGALFWSNDGTLLSEVEDRITRPYDIADPHAYGLRVRGDSMLRFYKPGDLVVVSPRTPVTDGDEVYVQLLSGERLIKVAHRMNDGFLLESYNQAYPPRFVERANVGAMHPIVWSKRKPSGVRATITRASQLPTPKSRRSTPPEPAAPPRDDTHDFSQVPPNGDPIWVDERDRSDD